MKKFLDTNILLHNLDYVRNLNEFIISSVTLEEIEHIKTSRNKDNEVKFNARQITRYLFNNKDKYKVIVTQNKHHELLDKLELEHSNDNLIMACAKLLGQDVEFYTLDLCCFNIGKDIFKLNVVKINYNNGIEYKGYLEKSLKTEKINDLFNEYNNGNNIFNLLENQYLIIHNIDLDKTYEYKYENNCLNQIKLPSSNIIKGQNSQQRLALDLLMDKNIPIKFICGNYGSGKTLLATKMGLYHIKEKDNYSKIMLIRQPCSSGSQEIGFLKGTKEDKIRDFFKPIIQHLDGGIIEYESLKQEGSLTSEIPMYMKGLDVQDTYMLIDEAEDLTKKEIKLIGSRINKNSSCVFVGDYKQAEGKYKIDNGLKIAIEKLKGNPLVGIVVLDEDIRSEASKVFSLI